jgi:steroid delta-isomerase-like uncharacterized protein
MVASARQPGRIEPRGVTMTPEEHKSRMRDFYETIGSKHDMEALGDFLADDFVDHDAPPGMATGPDGIREMFAGFVAAFPDLRMSPETMYVDGNTVVSRVRMSGTHRGEFMGIPATGKPFTVQGIDIIRFEDGKAAERWGNFDDLSMMHQLGVIPPIGEQ